LFQGELPSSGRVIIRSGLAWMDERAPLFVQLEQAMIPLLEQRGLTVAPAPASALQPMPQTLMDPAIAQAPIGSPGRPDPNAGDQDAAKAKAAELAQSGALPKARMERYDAPVRDADLPASVRAVVPMDPSVALFAISQRQGVPLMRRGGAIPGRLPKEMSATDPALADYVMVARFAVVRPMSARSSRHDAGMTAAGTVAGVASLGYGSPGSATWSASGGSSYGASPLDYARGYEAGSPRDPWNRQYDMRARDYTWRNAPLSTAPPPADGYGTLGGAGSEGSARELPLAFRSLPGSGTMGFALELECYSLAPVREGKAPVRVWKSAVRQRADSPNLEAALPDMARHALGAKK
jgi:hypothetical protein